MLYEEERRKMTELPHSKICFQFAELICQGNFTDAHSLLSEDLQKTISPTELQKRYVNMIHYVPEDEKANETSPFVLPTVYDLGIQATLEEYANKQENDVGWAYCSICCDGYSEAVSVVVEKDATGKLVIRSIEWGRP